MSSPAEMTLRKLWQMGYTAGLMQALPHVSSEQDLGHCADVVAVHPRERGALAVQTSANADQANARLDAAAAERLTASLSTPALRAWLTAGNLFEVWSWRMIRPIKDRPRVWVCDRRPVYLADLPGIGRPEEDAGE